jgi:uncharacterized LabA/DUF88 family protein
MNVAWFVDGSYAFKCWQSVSEGRAMDYKKLRDMIEADAGAPVDEAYYFGSDNDPPSAAQNAFHKAIAIPAPNGAGLRVKLYWLETKTLHWPQSMGGGPVLHPISNVPYEQKIQKGVDVGLAFHLMRSFAKRKWDRLYLVAGDGDFHEVIQHLVENENVHVTVLGTPQTISAEIGPYCRPLYFAYIADRIAR